MKLKQIKLAGFKSFVDPTVMMFPSQLVAVLGPNGCGKSNVIDAVRWVLGESSAKHLRGESMADVIFNGTTSRKPVGQASVELIFDNREGRLGGEYARYEEIGIKRVVTRDGQSQYFFNQTRCRRRDIADLFLGTGLGARSYAVIEQGMISRFIEAKPDEMRNVIEEAAGISKYKERRRETELRMQHTEENLKRLLDICHEHEERLTHLKKQAEVAERYQKFKQQERNQSAHLIALRWLKLNHDLSQFQQQLSEQHLQLESANTERGHFETQLIQQQETLYDLQQKQQVIQEAHYQFGKEIAETEQTLKHQSERRQTLQQQLQQLEQEQKQAKNLLKSDEAQLIAYDQQHQILLPDFQRIATEQTAAQEQVKIVETGWQQAQQQWDQFQQRAAQSTKLAEVEQTHIQHLEKDQQNLQERIKQLQQSQQQYQQYFTEINLADLQKAVETQSQAVTEKEQQLQTAKQAMQLAREAKQKCDHEWQEKRGQLQSVQSQQQALQRLQEMALTQDDKAVHDWCAKQNILQLPRLAQCIEVEAGWERAVETVLGFYLQAVCVDSLENFFEQLQSPPQGMLLLAEKNSAQIQTSNNHLLHFVKTDLKVVHDLLQSIYIAEDLNSARQQLAQLKSHESIITKQGIWLGKNWLSIHFEQNKQTGVLIREREIQQLTKVIQEADQALNQAKQALITQEEKVNHANQQVELLQTELQQLKIIAAEHNTKLQLKQKELQQTEQRLQSVQNDSAQQQQRLNQCEIDLAQARERWQVAITQMNEQADERQIILSKRDATQQELQIARQQAASLRQEHQTMQFKIQTNRQEHQSLEKQLARLTAQVSQLDLKQTELNQTIANLPILKESEDHLQSLLLLHAEKETELNQFKHSIQTLQADSTEMNQQKQLREQTIRQLQISIDDLRVKEETTKVRKQTLEEQISETQLTLQHAIEQLTASMTVEDLEQNLMQTKQKIDRLGLINLAAIDEYQSQMQRKTYLEQQRADLQEALDTLVGAIRKIDKETRTQFKETFDLINLHFQRYFPKLFGGGQSSLQLTSDEWLDAGVSIMAHPPGKRNSTIHLLSGGEKALTAIALVFAIFELNPAPFCLLDEVDAPLDDANVVRFCEVVKEMSDSVQFIFVSHNKIAMEMASHLIGVTMSEPGVSRLVSVSIAEAIAMTEGATV